MSTDRDTQLVISDNNSRTTRIAYTFWDNLRKSVKKRFAVDDWLENSLDIFVVFFIISLAMFVRVILAYTFREKWGYGLDENIWNRNMVFNIKNIEIRGFADFSYYYHSWIEGWYNGNWYPYQWHETPNVLDFYSYPPVFIYFLVLTWRPGMSDFWMAFPMILADASCAGVVYLILKNLFKNDRARAIGLIGGVLMALAPINVIYDGIYWLNPGPVTLFTLIAFYFAIKNKWWQAFFWIAVATMTKQNALFFTYPMFFAMLGEKIRNKTIKETIIESLANVILYILVALALSLPWIAISPVEYGRHLLFPGRPIELRFTVIDPVANDCVSFAKSLEQVGFPGWILAIVSFFNYSMLGMILFCSIIAVFMAWRSYYNKMDGIEFFEWIAVYTIVSHIMMPRGVYKFYVAYFTPMLLIAFLGAFVEMLNKKKFLFIGIISGSALFFGFNIWLLVIPRFPVPFFLGMTALVVILISWFRAYLRDTSKMKFVAKTFDYLKKPLGNK